ncbi:hypothetical protein QE152_g39965 [Popillia japonica]|uniref:Uncharacterized protein n=1 Tax=Popillia japonica TaxID=7064 RepID=A0AAW1HSN1_POPJA
MKIGDLEMHCGNCNVVEFCGNPYGYCLCYDTRFADVEEDTYRRIAEGCKSTPHAACYGCEAADCECCDDDDDRLDNMCEQFADYVAEQLELLKND